MSYEYDQKFLNLFTAFLITVSSRDTTLGVGDYCEEAIRVLYNVTMHCDNGERSWKDAVLGMMTPQPIKSEDFVAVSQPV